ncbi:MAG TPA: MarR family transcriptional regulator, partial [Alloacidobacterium sp.]|nr:MarR family transcriptional regulator [Alloacidobacterium sp.]
MLTSNSLVREINSIRCLREIRASGPVSRAELARILNMSRATVGNAIRPLLTGGLAAEKTETREPGGAGR